jgi:CubicO group peptidase (beta-lactamase class C family)
VAAIDDYIARQMTARGFVGLSVSIVKDGAIVLDKGYGRSQLDPDAPVQSDTAFSIGSITKQFISTLILLLADERKLSLGRGSRTAAPATRSSVASSRRSPGSRSA